MKSLYLYKIASFFKYYSNEISKKIFIGTCVDSFDENGYCVVNDLPWHDVSQFAHAEENSKKISMEQFMNNVVLDVSIKKLIKGHNKIYLKSIDGVYILYDDTTDIHYFFV